MGRPHRKWTCRVGGLSSGAMRCPRCKAEVPQGAADCPRCAAPLSLREEPKPVALDADLTLDRRRDRERRAPPPDRAVPTDDAASPDDAVSPGEAVSRDEAETVPAPWAGELARPPLDITEPSPWRRRGARPPPPGGRSHPPVPAGAGPIHRATPPIWPRDEEAPPAGSDGIVAEEAGFEILGPGPGLDSSDPARSPAAGPELARDAKPGAERAPAEPTERRFPPPPARQVPLPLPPAGPHLPAPRGKRALSWAVDGTLAGALAWLLLAGGSLAFGTEASAPSPVALLPAAAGLAAAIHFVHASIGVGLAGQTLGKWMVALQVLGPDGRVPSPGLAAARALLSILSAGLLGAGLALALADRRGRAPHDIALGTELVRVP